jgi:hypothetical protein
MCPGGQRLTRAQEAFLALPPVEQERALHSMNLDEQLELHVAAMTRVHPPILAVSTLIAHEEYPAFNPLLCKIKIEKEQSRLDALCILARDLSRSMRAERIEELFSELRRTIRGRASSRKVDFFKRHCEQRSMPSSEVRPWLHC